MLKTAFLGIGTLLAGVGVLAAWGSVAACQNLDATSPLFDAAGATVYDAGYIPPEPTGGGEDPGSGSLPTGVTPNTLRVRLANLTQGGQALKLCYAQAPSTAFVVAQDVTSSAKLDAVGTGIISAPVNVGPITSMAAGKFQFAVGTDCTTKPGTLATVAPTSNFFVDPDAGSAAGKSVTLVVAGDPEADPTSPLVPRLIAVNDVLSPSLSSTSFRAANGVVGFPPFDVVVNGDTVLTGIRFNTAVPPIAAPGYPFSASTGYVSIGAGIPAGSTLTLRSGTTIKNFTVPTRVRRGVAETLIVTGSSVNDVAASLCSDRAPESGATQADCTSLPPG